MIDPHGIKLTDPDGATVSFADLAADPLVVILVRYFGCLPCQAYLREVDAAVDRFDDEARVVAIGGSADYQAQWLRDEQKISMPLLLDPDQQVRDLVQIGDLTSREMMSAKGAGNYLRAKRSGLRFQKPTKDAKRAPGVAVFGPDLSVTWTHRGKELGGYPPLDEVVRRAGR